jgi:peptidoglycan/xylan/chitin deacetylase (PgdA/CDA1 family)
VARDDLALAPTAVYRAKAALTRLRSWRWRLRGRPPAPGLRILFYHRVSDDRDELAVTPARFAEQMARLARDGLRAVDVEEGHALLAAGQAQGVVGLCFDDGYADVARNAVPVLERHGFRATVFLPTGVLDGSAAFTWYATQPALLTWDDVRALDRGGALRFGAHTVTHPNLLALDEPAARAEIAGSRAALEERLGHAVGAFCYPAGLFGARERGLVADAGFALATSCEPGVNGPETDPLALRRIQVDARDRLLDFRAKVGGGHDAAPGLRSVYRRLRFGTPAKARS